MWSPPGQSATLHDIVKDGAWLVQAALCSERDVQARDGRRRRGESQRSEQLHGDPTSASPRARLQGTLARHVKQLANGELQAGSLSLPCPLRAGSRHTYTAAALRSS